ncbi:MAG: hypothetical protein Q9169_005950 [Polycauliona sp. 2 TL-2023]
MISIRTLLILTLTTFTVANPFPISLTPALTPTDIGKRECVKTCRSTCYTQSTIDAAISKGCSYLRSNTRVGDYPYVYINYDDFYSNPDAAKKNPHYMFPILASSQSYTGGSPGPDRVVFTKSCELQSLITRAERSKISHNRGIPVKAAAADDVFVNVSPALIARGE